GTTFSDYAVNVLASTPGDIYIGFTDTFNMGGTNPPRNFPAPQDTTASQVRSWVAAQDDDRSPDYDNLGLNDNLVIIDDFLPGNWAIRASGDTQVSGGGGCPSPTVVVGTPTPTACVVTSWVDRAPLTELRGRAVGATMGNEIYVFGGRPAGTTYTNTIYRYNTNTNTWTLMTETLPDDRTSNMAAGVLTFPEGDRIFIAGGSGPSSAVISRTLAYNPSAGTLTPKASWPAAPTRIPGGWAVANNKFYIFGGYNPAVPEVLADIWEYNPTTDAWTELSADLTLARGYIATELLPDGMIYLAGGFDDALADTSAFDIFNPGTGAITAGPTLLQPKSNAQGYNVGGKFVMPSGGIDPENHDTNTWVYDPVAGAWSAGVPTLHATRNYAKGYGTDGSIYVIGGADQLGSTFYDFTQQMTSVAGQCATATPEATATTEPPTSTAVASSTATAVEPTATVGPTACPIQYVDVPPGSEFYPYIRCLACRKIANGYACGGPGEPCDGNNTGYFRPFMSITRGQIAKMVSNAAGFGEDPGPQIFEDVPPSNPFYAFINRLTMRGHMGGYTCGGAFEPCVPPGNRPYFRPGANATRGQVSKIVANAAGITTPIPAGTQTYEDVPSSNPFWVYIERLTALGVMSGYPCGGAFEPCVPPGNRPYFRPFAEITRAQTSKIVANTFYPNCQTPVRPVAPAKEGTH
ncbi:MAG TPA: kelch repeat-containing protein, partial [Chloroflexia bacterium]|nr:kelch repeat-containing protein [Chloroflexia bacterium]